MNTEQLTAAELQKHLEQGTFRLALVGMSNAGKSHRSRRLKGEEDFAWYEVDAHIQKQLDIADMDDISNWLGYPTMDVYAERAQQYLDAEEKCTHLNHLDTEGKNLVFDTTGSVIYISDTAKEWLHDECLVVHVDIGEDSIEEMARRYFEEPKPVLWGDVFNQKEGEDDMDALKRCYPELLKSRLKEYRAFAHLSIPVAELYDTTGADALTVIQKHLEKSKR